MSAALRPLLREAEEALHLALLTLRNNDDERSKGALEAHAAQARSFLLEAVHALGTARVRLPAIRTYSPAVVMSSEPRVHSELDRLYQLATRMLWWNIHLLPARRRATPLAPEDEAQLAVVLNSLARTAKIDHFLEYGWLALMMSLAALGPIFGVPLFSVVVGALAFMIATWKLAKMKRRALALSAS